MGQCVSRWDKKATRTIPQREWRSVGLVLSGGLTSQRKSGPLSERLGIPGPEKLWVGE